MAPKTSQKAHAPRYNYFSQALNRACRAEDFVNDGPNSWLLAGALMGSNDCKEEGLSKTWKDWAKKHPNEATIIRRGVANFCLADGVLLKPDLPPGTKTKCKKLVISEPGSKSEARGKDIQKQPERTEETFARKRQASEAEAAPAIKRQKCEPKQESAAPEIPEVVDAQLVESHEQDEPDNRLDVVVVVVPEQTEPEKNEEECHYDGVQDAVGDSDLQATATTDVSTQGLWGNLRSYWDAVTGL
ncbi:hypothetical protein AK830_g4324 [Neonectria ditissima]|uniref:Uncharacterized protein n=1 Tax=Neonectria ditissima TaxID=78410 RepID=A0A0P7AW74_9HYPO|nr:hypothetical protein AK830_g4324 [Neonectria ditissima]